MTSSNGNIFRVTGPLCGEFTGPGEFPAQRPVTRSFDVFFDLRPNKRLSKQPWGWWFETLSWSLWRQCNVCLTDHGNTGCLCNGFITFCYVTMNGNNHNILDFSGNYNECIISIMVAFVSVECVYCVSILHSPNGVLSRKPFWIPARRLSVSPCKALETRDQSFGVF